MQATPDLDNFISLYNSCVADCDTLSVSSLKDNSPNQKKLSDSIEVLQFNSLFSTSSATDRARLLPISPPHASSWISVVPSVSLGLPFDPQEFNTALKWQLGVNPSVGLDGYLMTCPFCPGNSLDPLGYHCVTCKRGGDVTLRHNAIRDVLFNTFCTAGLSSHLEFGNGWGQDCSRTRLADFLVTNWDNGISAVFNVTVTSPLYYGSGHVFWRCGKSS